LLKDRTKKSLAVLFSILSIPLNSYVLGNKTSIKNSSITVQKIEKNNNKQSSYSKKLLLIPILAAAAVFSDELKHLVKSLVENSTTTQEKININNNKSLTEDRKNIYNITKISQRIKNFNETDPNMLAYINAVDLLNNKSVCPLKFEILDENVKIKTCDTDIVHMFKSDNFPTLENIVTNIEGFEFGDIVENRIINDKDFIFGFSENKELNVNYQKDNVYIDKVKEAAGRTFKNRKITKDELEQFNRDISSFNIEVIETNLNEALKKKDSVSVEKIVSIRETINKIESDLLETVKDEILNAISSVLGKAGYNSDGKAKAIRKDAKREIDRPKPAEPGTKLVPIPSVENIEVYNKIEKCKFKDLAEKENEFTFKKSDTKSEFILKNDKKDEKDKFFVMKVDKSEKTIKISGFISTNMDATNLLTLIDRAYKLLEIKDFKDYVVIIDSDFEFDSIHYLRKVFLKINPKEITLKKDIKIILKGRFVITRLDDQKIEFFIEQTDKSKFIARIDKKTRNIEFFTSCSGRIGLHIDELEDILNLKRKEEEQRVRNYKITLKGSKVDRDFICNFPLDDIIFDKGLKITGESKEISTETCFNGADPTIYINLRGKEFLFVISKTDRKINFSGKLDLEINETNELLDCLKKSYPYSLKDGSKGKFNDEFKNFSLFIVNRSDIEERCFDELEKRFKDVRLDYSSKISCTYKGKKILIKVNQTEDTEPTMGYQLIDSTGKLATSKTLEFCFYINNKKNVSVKLGSYSFKAIANIHGKKSDINVKESELDLKFLAEQIIKKFKIPIESISYAE